jgi:mRNA interferase MazF
MGKYLPGDVVLVSIAIDDQSGAKTRPAVVIAAREDGSVSVCPVSSKPPNDAPCIPLSIDDFETGGLDLFSESYIMVTRVRVVRSGDVIGKRGHMLPDAFGEVADQARDALGADEKNRKGSQRSRPGC